MGSGLLYLAIVGVWAGVLVPMWVRRSDAGETRGAEPAPVPRGQGRARARVVARRRRRLTGIVALFAATVVIAVAGVAPVWIIPVPGLLLVGYLACLRAAAVYDAELRERDEARAGMSVLEEMATPEDSYESGTDSLDGADASEDVDRMGDGTRGESQERDDSRVIDFRERVAARRDEPFDQHADQPRRAVGD